MSTPVNSRYTEHNLNNREGVVLVEEASNIASECSMTRRRLFDRYIRAFQGLECTCYLVIEKVYMVYLSSIGIPSRHHPIDDGHLYSIIDLIKDSVVPNTNPVAISCG